ncbi:hypothetical protein ACFX2J_035728 [Malus domestica]
MDPQFSSLQDRSVGNMRLHHNHLCLQQHCFRKLLKWAQQQPMHRCFVGLALCHPQRLPRKKRERKSEHGRDPGHEGPERMAADALFNTLPAAFVQRFASSLLGFLLISTMDADESDDLSREEEASDTKSMEEGEMAQQQKPRLPPEMHQIPHELPHRPPGRAGVARRAGYLQCAHHLLNLMPAGRELGVKVEHCAIKDEDYGKLSTSSGSAVEKKTGHVAPVVVDVNLGNRSYSIYVGSGLLEQAELLERHGGSGSQKESAVSQQIEGWRRHNSQASTSPFRQASCYPVKIPSLQIPQTRPLNLYKK